LESVRLRCGISIHSISGLRRYDKLHPTCLILNAGISSPAETKLLVGDTFALTGANVKSIRMVRVLRALRVVSQFKSLRKIVQALTQAVLPVLSAMFVAVIAIAVFSILGVNFFAEKSPEDWGDFGRAAWTLVTAATLENWVAYADDLMLSEPRSLDAGVIAFFVTYILIVGYVMTSVIIAVLLENFSDASRAEVRKPFSLFCCRHECRVKPDNFVHFNPFANGRWSHASGNCCIRTHACANY
jgi:hypothetical protein